MQIAAQHSDKSHEYCEDELYQAYTYPNQKAILL